MTATLNREAVFTDEVVGIIWRELLQAHDCQPGYKGIVFDDPYSIRASIWTWYASSATTRSGQDQWYEPALWPKLLLTFQMLDFVATAAGYPHMVRQEYKFRHHARDSVVVWLMFEGGDAPPEGLAYICRCLYLVDQSLAVLQSACIESQR